ncbi:MAG TPA: hypothetical protein VF835_01570 [Rhizomicrobium sp.]
MALSLGAAVLSVPASAEESGNLATCVKLAGQVSQALAGSAQSPSYDAAKKEKGFGRDYCASGLYAQGTTHYAEALKLLGAERSASSTSSSAS